MVHSEKFILNSSSTILVWGGRSQARIILDMIEDNQLGHVEYIFDSTLTEVEFLTKAKFTNDTHFLKGKLNEFSHYIVCIAGEYGYARYKVSEYLESLGLKSISCIHDKSFIEKSSIIGKGSQVMPGAIVHKFCEIGDYIIINTNASIDHECMIGDGVHVMGGAAIAGKVTIGDFATIGTNATVLPSIKIGTGAFIGAGAVVTKDVEPYSIVVGVPARVLRKREMVFIEKDLNELACY